MADCHRLTLGVEGEEQDLGKGEESKITSLKWQFLMYYVPFLLTHQNQKG